LCASPNIITVTESRRMNWAGHVARIVKMRNSYNIFIDRPEKWPLGRARRRWEDNIRMDLRETGWESVDWIHLFLLLIWQWTIGFH